MKRYSGLLLALGLVLVVFALLNFFVGLFAVYDPFWIGVNLAAGLLLLAAGGFSNLDAVRERMRSGEGRRVGSVTVKLLRKCPSPVWTVKPDHDLELKLVSLVEGIPVQPLRVAGTALALVGAWLAQPHR